METLPGAADGPQLPFLREPGRQGRAGRPPARRLQLCCRHQQLERGVPGRLAPTHTSLMLPAAAGTGAASPTSPPAILHPAWGPTLGDSTPGHRATRRALGVVLGTGTSAGLPTAYTGISPLAPGSYWGRMCIMSRGVAKD